MMNIQNLGSSESLEVQFKAMFKTLVWKRLVFL